MWYQMFHIFVCQLSQKSLTGTVPLVRVQGIAVVAATAEAADGVSASPIRAQSVYHPALIYVWGLKRKEKPVRVQPMGHLL